MIQLFYKELTIKEVIMKIDDLNKEQQKAVLVNSGPLLILAGAGSGKTKVLTTKIAYLIDALGVKPYNILETHCIICLLPIWIIIPMFY